MAAECAFRIDTVPPSDDTLARVRELVRHYASGDLSAYVTPAGDVVFGRARYETAPIDRMLELSAALHALVGGTLRHTDDFGALGPAFDLPEDGLDLSPGTAVAARRPHRGVGAVAARTEGGRLGRDHRCASAFG